MQHIIINLIQHPPYLNKRKNNIYYTYSLLYFIFSSKRVRGAISFHVILMFVIIAFMFMSVLYLYLKSRRKQACAGLHIESALRKDY